MAKRQPRGDTGAKSTSVYLTDEERALWDAVASELKLSKKEALIDGLKALRGSHNGGPLTNEELVAELKRRLG
jgi:hypothetical protein